MFSSITVNQKKSIKKHYISCLRNSETQYIVLELAIDICETFFDKMPKQVINKINLKNQSIIIHLKAG